jgi:hypothetical protein
MRRSSIFKKTDVTRATRAVLAAGLEVRRVEINSRDGTITMVPAKPGEIRPTAELIADGAPTLNALDRELADFKAQHDQD